eukprot:TRINITY_DN3641_c0_g1_i4.p2 TRINITY_DN3641_c0_g1~~TRINITY_DN3641_c0_g1_i4.p2  ORF type:complete len:117 (-),score=15.17 TRINITY_DN3641_c0_g1_i4:33-383(-)
MMEETGVTEVGGGGCNVCGTVLAVGAVGGTTAQFASSLLLCCSVRGGHGCCLRAERTRAAELLAPPPSSSLLDGPVRDGPEPLVPHCSATAVANGASARVPERDALSAMVMDKKKN